MPVSATPEAARALALGHYGAAVEGLRWAALGSGGGFSGAYVWRGDDPAGTPVLALKAWPDTVTADRLVRIHGWMRQASHLPFVPAVVPARTGATVAVEAGRVWDLTRWMPGTADFHANPTPARLANACAALAQLHRAWAPPTLTFAPCPAVHRRLHALAQWRARAPRPDARLDPELGAAARRGAEAVARLAAPAERALRPWADEPVAVQPCLCDVWHDHVLFAGDDVTGIIDYGAMKVDHVAVDLARLLGDLIGDAAAAFDAGLAAYRTAGGRLDLPPKFVRLLDRTGTVCGVISWLLRLAADPPPPAADPRAVTARLARLTARLDAFPAF